MLTTCKKFWQELLAVGMAEAAFLIGWKTSPFLHQLFCLEHCFFFYPFFMMGYYMRRYRLMEIIKSKNWLFTVSLIGFACLLNANIEIHALRFLSERVLRPAFAIIAISYLFCIREDKSSMLERWLNRIGTKTLDIYMYHCLFLSGTFMIFDLQSLKNSEVMNSNPTIYFLIALIITIFLSYVSIAIGYLVRGSDFLRKIIYGK